MVLNDRDEREPSVVASSAGLSQRGLSCLNGGPRWCGSIDAATMYLTSKSNNGRKIIMPAKIKGPIHVY